ncbi:hypothetical protein PVK06_005174 [Gossypium arboreum]|uniref:Uncharacterized protein n=1 Tax=Gossypium arboreum TaxID=29729 RepID=A0ABR0QV65_GOSAR|nr:hypothetical protein PVK06_005174 [Gossypium arboreum]
MLGKLISRKIDDCAKKKTGCAYFPSLITSLCLRAHVKRQANLKGQYVQGCITSHDLERLIEKVHELNQGEQGEPTEPIEDPKPRVEPEEEPVKLSVEPEYTTPLSTSASTSRKSELSMLMDMCKFMHNQQQTSWKYAKIRDDSIRNTFKNISNTFVPKFPNVIFETWMDDTYYTSGEGAKEDKGNKSKE